MKSLQSRLNSLRLSPNLIRYSVKIVNIEFEPCGAGAADTAAGGGAASGRAATKGPWGLYKTTVVLADGTTAVLESEALLNATGRVPNVCDLGLEAVGVEYDNRQGVHVDDTFATSNLDVYACGDCASPFKFTHAADWQVTTAAAAAARGPL